MNNTTAFSSFRPNPPDAAGRRYMSLCVTLLDAEGNTAVDEIRVLIGSRSTLSGARRTRSGQRARRVARTRPAWNAARTNKNGRKW